LSSTLPPRPADGCSAELAAFAERIGHAFGDATVLRRALTHRSFGADHNERLEFLGDSVLNCAIATELYCRFPRLTEGELSRLRANLVNQPTLAAVALQLGIGDCLRLGEGELKSGGRRRPSMLADALEAVIGAVFVDGGFEAARCMIRRQFGPRIEVIDPRASGKDPKTLLQEYLQGRRIALPRYSVTAITGEAHEQLFEVECAIAELDIRASGTGPNRRSAEQDAARRAYELAAGR
jgi:ribonuclease-3